MRLIPQNPPNGRTSIVASLDGAACRLNGCDGGSRGPGDGDVDGVCEGSCCVLQSGCR